MSRAAECGTPCLAVVLRCGAGGSLSQGHGYLLSHQTEQSGVQELGEESTPLPLWSQQPAVHMRLSLQVTSKVRSPASRLAWLFQPTSSSHSTHSYSIGETQRLWARRHVAPLQPSLAGLPTTERRGSVLLHFFQFAVVRQLCSCVNGNRGGKAHDNSFSERRTVKHFI